MTHKRYQEIPWDSMKVTWHAMSHDQGPLHYCMQRFPSVPYLFGDGKPVLHHGIERYWAHSKSFQVAGLLGSLKYTSRDSFKKNAIMTWTVISSLDKAQLWWMPISDKSWNVLKHPRAFSICFNQQMGYNETTTLPQRNKRHPAVSQETWKTKIGKLCFPT